jgi:hypothetical protein
MNRELVPLAVMLILLVAGVVSGGLWLVSHLKPLLHLMLILFLAASG